MEKLPFKSVIANVCSPTTAILTPINGCPCSSITTPDILLL